MIQHWTNFPCIGLAMKEKLMDYLMLVRKKKPHHQPQMIP